MKNVAATSVPLPDEFPRKDCRHMRSDRPCGPYKTTGQCCGTCGSYSPKGIRILVIKFDATGDVLRTTALLGPLKHRYPSSHVTWVTKPAAVSVLENIAEVDEILENNADTLARIAVEEFDLLLHPDASAISAAWAAAAKARRKIGMQLLGDGTVTATNPAVMNWLRIGQNDRLKRENTSTYQFHLLAGCELGCEQSDIIVRLSPSELGWAREYATQHAIESGACRQLVIGLNTGAGARWKHKKWTLLGYKELISEMLTRYTRLKILLLGEKGEQARNQELALMDPERIIDTGVHPMREFFGVMSLCDIVVTGDTLGLHAALGLKKRVVAIFGPTSSDEIELYGRGEKIVTQLPCRCCYLPDCNVRPTCMDTISCSEVMEAVARQVDLVGVEFGI